MVLGHDRVEKPMKAKWLTIFTRVELQESLASKQIETNIFSNKESFISLRDLWFAQNSVIFTNLDHIKSNNDERKFKAEFGRVPNSFLAFLCPLKILFGIRKYNEHI